MPTDFALTFSGKVPQVLCAHLSDVHLTWTEFLPFTVICAKAKARNERQHKREHPNHWTWMNHLLKNFKQWSVLWQYLGIMPFLNHKNCHLKLVKRYYWNRCVRSQIYILKMPNCNEIQKYCKWFHLTRLILWRILSFTSENENLRFGWDNPLLNGWRLSTEHVCWSMEKLPFASEKYFSLLFKNDVQKF